MFLILAVCGVTARSKALVKSPRDWWFDSSHYCTVFSCVLVVTAKSDPANDDHGCFMGKPNIILAVFT